MFNLKFLIYSIFSQIRSIFLVVLNSFCKKETKKYPDEPISLSDNYRGKLILTRDSNKNERCVACGLCAVVCPSSCIIMSSNEDKVSKRRYASFFEIDFSRCIFCGFCEESCPTNAIQLIPNVELSEYNRENLLYKKKDLLILGEGKYKNYNFYDHSGIFLDSKVSEKSNRYKKNLVDIKTLLP